jgi:cyclase
MINERVEHGMTRREMLRGGVMLTGGLMLTRAWPAAAQATDALAERRMQMAAAPIQTQKLTDALTMLSGPGGNVVVLNGRDGKVVVDSFVQPAWDKLKQALDASSKDPCKLLIDTHWHFDHADNNANFRKIGAGVLAHANTSKRLAEPHDLLGMKFPASPPEALPTQTFTSTHKVDANGDTVMLGYIKPAHTDTDIYIHFAKADVLHLGDLFFNGSYPFIDGSTGGTINGMIAGVGEMLKMAGANTKIVPGHGPLADKAALTKYRDMMVTVRDRVQKLKTSGRKVEEVVAAKPTADLDATFGKGFMTGDNFVALVYNVL